MLVDHFVYRKHVIVELLYRSVKVGVLRVAVMLHVFGHHQTDAFILQLIVHVHDVVVIYQLVLCHTLIYLHAVDDQHRTLRLTEILCVVAFLFYQAAEKRHGLVLDYFCH